MPIQMHMQAIYPVQWTLDEVIKNVIEQWQLLALEGKALFQSTTLTWKHKPKFQVLITPKTITGTARDAVIRIYTTDKVYGYVDKGTKGPYPISPRQPTSSSGRPSSLRFQAGYRAKTRAGATRFASGPGGPFGPMTHRAGVIHPGIKGRKFSERIQAELLKRLYKRIGPATQKGLMMGIRQGPDRPIRSLTAR